MKSLTRERHLLVNCLKGNYTLTQDKVLEFENQDALGGTKS